MNTKKPNFVIISGSGDTFVWFRLELLAAIQRKGFKVYALAPEISDKNMLILEEKGINFLRINLKRKSFNIINFIQSCIQLNKIFIELKPEIVLGYMHKSILASCIVSIFHKNIKVFSMITGLGHLFERQSLKYSILKRVLSIFFKISFKRASKVFFQNPDDKNLFLNLNLVNEEKSVCIPGSGVNTEKFNKIALPDSPIFMTMGRFLESKGLREFAAAAQQMKFTHPEARFILYGYSDAHEDSISEQEIEQTWFHKYGVELMGFADDPKFAISQCSVFVLLSYREGVPRTVLEAMSMGRSIITTDAPGCRETVENGLNGFLVPVADVKNTVFAMKKLYDASLRSKMGAYSRQIAIKKFDVNLVNKIIINNII